MNIQIKAEHNRVKAGSRSQLGLMIEVTAPVAPVAETAIQRKEKGLVFCIDQSGSMGGSRIELVKQTILDLLPRLAPTDYFAVVTFETRSTVVAPMKRIADHNLADLKAVISAITAKGNTNLELGYRTALAEAAKAPEQIETSVILLSDGQANAGVREPALLGQLAASATEHMIATSTLGIGEGYNENILDALSISGNGNHFAAFRLEEAVTGLADEIDGLLARTIENLKIEISYAASFREGTIAKKTQYLRAFQASAHGATANLGDLASGEEKNFTFDLDLKPQTDANGEPVEAFTVRYSYQDLLTGQTMTGERVFSVDVASPENFVEPLHDEDIVAELAATRAQAVKEEAIELMRQGRESEAKKLMAKIGQDLSTILRDFDELSDRQKERLRRQVEESRYLSDLQNSEEFIKRGVESVNRARRSKIDPRENNN